MAGSLYRHLLRPLLFRHEAEAIHDQTMRRLERVSRHPSLRRLVSAIYGSPELPVEVFGLRFPNPIGLAAGMDKFARALAAWPALGFGFAEIGGVTWHEQPGNPQPRLFRAVTEEAIVNAMGFNNPGAEKMAHALAACRQRGDWPAHPVGVNLGKSKITPLEKAAEDYANSFRLLRDHADFFVVNVSSPNTPNLRQLQDKHALSEILAALQELNPAPAKPVLVKVAPDLSFDALDEILDLVETRHVAGLVATNTTISRPETSNPSVKQIYSRPGGLSGRPLRQRSTEVIRHLYKQSHGKVPIIGVGGIFDANDAWEKITAGATLLQLYTSLVYRGPSVNREIVLGLQSKLRERNLQNLSQAVGRAELL